MIEEASGNIFMRKWRGLKKGHVRKGHTHKFDHTTIVFIGGVHVKAVFPDGKVIEKDFISPSHFLVRAEVKHQITALEDGTQYWCVYSHRNAQGEIVQENDGWSKAYS